MTLYSVAQCCRLLAIDAKTLHRWLTHAQLTLHPSATDARRKGLTVAHLRLLATTHHRALPPLPGEVSPVLDAQTAAPVVFPPEVLALLESLSVLPAQLAALQQQVSALTALVEQHVPPPAPVVPVVVPPPRKPTPTPRQVIARVEWHSAGHYVITCPTQGRLAFAPESPAWFAWLETRSAFRFVGQHGHFTAHCESNRLPNPSWRAHRKIRNHSVTLHLARSEELTIAVLEQAAASMQARLQ